MQDQFWNKHYQSFAVHEPSRFARYCLTHHVRNDDMVIELGCGNGRDGLALGQAAAKYVGVDVCPVAVGTFRESCGALTETEGCSIEVVQGDFTGLDFASTARNAKRLVIYSRFSYHSITYPEAKRLLDNLAAFDSVPWVFLLEARTIWDTLYGEGEEIGVHEFKTDHYRRFIDPNVFLSDVASRFSVRYFEVASGLAPFDDQDPVVMRAQLQPRSS